MKPAILLRIAAISLLIFAFGHSVGHLTRHDVTDPKAIEVQRAMIDNKFDMFGTMRSYDENYEGMSINVIITLLSFVAALWIMSANINTSGKLIKKLLIPIMICVFGFAITSILYFFPGPASTCVIAGILIAVARIKIA